MKLIKCIRCRSTESIIEIAGPSNKVMYKCHVCGKISSQATSLDSRLKFDVLKNGELIHHSIGILIRNRANQLLLTKRRFYDYTWSIIFGHMHHGETPRVAAQRELIEETGIRPEELKYKFTRTIDTLCRTGVKKHKLRLFEIQVPNDVPVILNNELENAVWIKPADLARKDFQPLSKSTEYVFKRLKVT